MHSWKALWYFKAIDIVQKAQDTLWIPPSMCQEMHKFKNHEYGASISSSFLNWRVQVIGEPRVDRTSRGEVFDLKLLLFDYSCT